MEEKSQIQVLTPIVKSFQVLFGLSDKQVGVIKGQFADEAKYSAGTTFEERLSKLYVGSVELAQDRISKYRDYDRMDVSSTECSVALDIYAEEAAQKDSKTGLRVWVDSPEDQVAGVLNGMLQRIKLEQKSYGIYRNLAKYGDVHLYLLLGGFGIHDTQFIHPARVERVQTTSLLGFKSPELQGLLPSNNKGMIPPWEFVHFRTLAYDQESIYGRSMLDPVRKAWKSFQMLKTMIVLYRIARTVQRNIFYVDVGQASVEESHQLVADYKKFLKNKNYFTDPKTNEFKVDFDPAMFLQDIIWPVRPNSTSRVEPLQNNPNIGPLEDYENFLSEIRTGLGIPKEYLEGVQSGGWNSRESLMLQDIRFSKKIQKLQEAFREGVVKLCQIHWGILYGEYLDPQRFQVQLGTISETAERQREDVLLRKAQILEILSGVASTLGWNRWVWGDYLLDEIFPLPAETRAKLCTPDPVLNMEFEKEKELAVVDGGDKGKIKTADGIKTKKPNKHVTADSIKFGLRGFGYGEAKEDALDVNNELLEEFKQKQQEIKEIYNNVRPGDLIENEIFSFSPSEIKKLVDYRDNYKDRYLADKRTSSPSWEEKIKEAFSSVDGESRTPEYYLTEAEEFLNNMGTKDLLEDKITEEINKVID